MTAKNPTIKNKVRNLFPESLEPITAPAIPSSIVCPIHHPSNKAGFAVVIENRPKIKANYTKNPNSNPK